MKWVAYVLMGLGFAGMLWADRQYKGRGVAWGRPLAALLGIISLVCAISIIFSTLRGNKGEVNTIIAKEKRFQEIGYKKLGQKVAERFPKGRILLIREYRRPVVSTNPNAYDIGEVQVQAFREGLARKATIVAVEEVRLGIDEYEGAMGEPNAQPSEKDYKRMMEEMLSAKRFDELVEQYEDCNVVVSLVGLPDDFKKMKTWKLKPDRRPAIVLANAYVHSELEPLIKGKYVPIILENKPIKEFDRVSIPKDEEEAFKMRFFLITPENFEEIKKQYPNRFGSK